MAGAQIIGGLVAARLRRLLRRRTSGMLATAAVSTAALLLVGLVHSFTAVVALLVVWSLAFAAESPVRRAYLNALIPSQQRATVLPFDSLLSSTGGVVLQPGLGRAADVWGHPVTFVASTAFQACALPFLRLAQRLAVPQDLAQREPGSASPAV